MSTSNAIETEVFQQCALFGVTFAAVCLGERKRDDWICDEWVCTFTHSARPREPFELPFFTGTGHRKVSGKAPYYIKGRELAAWNRENAKPVTPHVAAVLHSLILDSSAACMTFRDWCAEFGASDDSIKARNTYDACQRSADMLRRLFTREQIETLQTLLQDY